MAEEYAAPVVEASCLVSGHGVSIKFRWLAAIDQGLSLMPEHSRDSQPASETDSVDLPTTPAPRWVKVFAGVAIVVIVAVILALVTGGEHGPGRHAGLSGESIASAGRALAASRP
jgi:hypothetical protein